MKSILHLLQKFQIRPALRERAAFTLIELLIAITIFTIFIGIAGTSYVSVARALRDANALRRSLAEARDLVETLVHDIRRHAIDYTCLQALDPASSPSETDCFAYLLPGQTRQHILPLVNRERSERVIYRFNKEQVDVCKQRRITLNVAGVVTKRWEDASGPGCTFHPIETPSFAIRNLHFVVTPSGDPFTEAHAASDALQFQPSVTVLLSGMRVSSLPTDLPIDLQTTVSSRLYFPHRSFSL